MVRRFIFFIDVSTINASSRVYYTQNEEGFVEIYFGDGVLGAGLKDGDIIEVTYIVVDEEHANGVKYLDCKMQSMVTQMQQLQH